MGQYWLSPMSFLLLVAFHDVRLMRLAPRVGGLSPSLKPPEIIAPMAKVATGYRPEMLYIAVAEGHHDLACQTDAGLWMVISTSAMMLPQSLKTWSTAQVMVAILGSRLSVGAGHSSDETLRFHFHHGRHCAAANAQTRDTAAEHDPISSCGWRNASPPIVWAPTAIRHSYSATSTASRRRCWRLDCAYTSTPSCLRPPVRR